ncbi:MAG: CPBP family intramembrane metalloprotease [Candidatus Latescibacterota bacterium]|nr:MAG: CPBP family intramembrane metalloprotease [Candidatus Latescibacterota bacterium]
MSATIELEYRIDFSGVGSGTRFRCVSIEKKDNCQRLSRSVMEERPEGNHDLVTPSIFSVLNNYLLLFFSVTCLLSSVFIQQLFYIIEQIRIGICVAPILGIILPVFLITRRFASGFRYQLAIRSLKPLVTAYVIVATLAAVVIVDFIYVLSQKFTPTPVDYLESLKEIKPTGIGSMLVTFFGLCIVVPIAEEVVFRGMIQRIFSRHMGGVLALLLAGVFFGVIHLTPQLLLSMVAFGIFLGYVFFATSNLTYPMLAHGIFNTVAFVQLCFSTEDELVSMPAYVRDYWLVGAATVVFVFLLIKMKKGDSVKSKTPPKSSDSSNVG